MIKITELAIRINEPSFYKDTKLNIILQGINEALSAGFHKKNLYSTAMTFIVQYDRIDILESIFNNSGDEEILKEAIDNFHLNQAFSFNSHEIISFFVDKGIINNIDNDKSYYLPQMPLKLLKKMSDFSLITEKHSFLVDYAFKERPVNFEKLDFFRTIGFKLEERLQHNCDYCFSIDIETTSGIISYFEKIGMKLNQNNNLLLVSAIQSMKINMIDFIVSQDIDLTIPDELVSKAFSSSIIKDTTGIMEHVLAIGITFNINEPNFVQWLAESNAIKLLKFCIPLGINIEEVKKHASDTIQDFLVNHLYEIIENSTSSKDNVEKRKIKI